MVKVLRSLVVVGAMIGLVVGAQSVAAQSIDEFDYENLTFRGFSLFGGYIFPSGIEGTGTIGVQLDLGYLAPGFRVRPSFSYWSSELESSEVASLSNKLESILVDQGLPPGSLDLGTIDRSDFVVALDGEFVWSIPGNMVSFLGAGVSAHFLNGSGAAISDTFVEDLLDSVQAGFNLHAGLEYPLLDRLRLQGSTRYEFTDDVRYFQLSAGVRVLWGGLAPGERRR